MNNKQNINGARPSCNNPLQVIVDENNIFNPYQALSGVNMYSSLNYAVNQMFGIDTRWFRSIPDKSTKDVILFEYTLYNVSDEPICLNVVLQDGTFPESNYKYDLMGLSYEVPLEVLVDINYWKNKVGIDTMPQKGDIVYFPINNKIYEVVSSSEVRGFMEQITAYKCNLSKYTPTANRRVGEDLNNTLDKYTFSTESVFGNEIKEDIQKLTDDRQLSANLNTSRDLFKKFDDKVTVINTPVRLLGFNVTDAYYDVSDSTELKAIEYNHNPFDCANKFMSTYQLIRYKSQANRKYDVNKIDYNPESGEFIFSLKTLNRIAPGQKVYFFKNNSKSINGYFIASKMEGDSVYCKIPNEILAKLNGIKSDWITLSGYKIDLKPEERILSGDNFNISIIYKRYIEFTLKDKLYVLDIKQDLNNDTWYSIICQFSFVTGCIGVILRESNPVYSPTLDTNSSRFNILFDHAVACEMPLGFIMKDVYIPKSQLDLSYLRIYDLVEPDYIKQENDLISNIVESPERAIVLDNVDTALNATYISRQR